MFDRSMVPMLLVDSRRLARDGNPAARLFLRRRRAEIRGRLVLELSGTEQQEALDEHWARMEAEGEATGRLTWVLRDGTDLLVDFYAKSNALADMHLLVWLPVGWDADDLGEERSAGRASPLTRREQQVLALLMDGLDVQHIAAELAIADNTVKAHIANVQLKLGARSRPHAVAIALRAGIVEP